MERPSKRARSLAVLRTSSSKPTGVGGRIARKLISRANGTTIKENIGSTLYGVMVILRILSSQRKPTIGITLGRLLIPNGFGGDPAFLEQCCGDCVARTDSSYPLFHFVVGESGFPFRSSHSSNARTLPDASAMHVSAAP